MKHKFDELTKDLAQSVTRRSALRRFGKGLTGIALASLGVASKAKADPGKNAKFSKTCDHCDPTTNYGCSTSDPNFAVCYDYCNHKCNPPGGY